jgi:hypothetical protein
MSMASKRSTEPLFQPGRQGDWEQINREEDRQEAEFAAGLSTSERLEFGQRLSDQAFELMNAVRAGGHVTARDPRT